MSFNHVPVSVQSQMKMKSADVVDGGLFTESYCNICNAQLISESQRTAHYEVSRSTLTQNSQNKGGRWKWGSFEKQIPLLHHSHQPYLYHFKHVLAKTVLIHYTMTKISILIRVTRSQTSTHFI